MKRTILHTLQGFLTQDGAGVKLVRVLGHNTTKIYDPILMLDSFDSSNPKDYQAGFPMHPHRGIETISYVYQGKMRHRDSLGNEDTIGDGEVQWMTAGSGIIHEETLPASPRLVGVQLWLNLPKEHKMVDPAYHSIKSSSIPEHTFPEGKLRVLAGSYGSLKGFQSSYQPLDYFDLHLNANSRFTLETKPDASVTLFSLQGSFSIDGKTIPAKTAVKLTEGTSVDFETREFAQILIISSVPLNEPIAWGGPIVMNTQAELHHAFEELHEGTFLKKSMDLPS